MTTGTFAPGSGLIQTYNVIPSPLNADWSHTVPPNTRAQLICGRATLTTGPLGLGRSPQLTFTSGGRVINRSTNYNPHPASRVENYTITAGSDQIAALSGFDYWLQFPPGILLQAANTVSVLTTNKRIADVWTNVVLRFIEWMEP